MRLCVIKGLHNAGEIDNVKCFEESNIPTDYDTFFVEENENLIKTVQEIYNKRSSDIPLIILGSDKITFKEIDEISNEIPVVKFIGGNGVFAYCKNNVKSEKSENNLKDFLNMFENVVAVGESYLTVFEKIRSSARILTAKLIESLAESGVKGGIPDKKSAYDIASQTVLGSAALVSESNEHPWSLVDRVCSPGGTTIEGLLTLQREGFDKAIIDAIDN